ncbi:MAG: glycosyltransferase family 4 protein [Chloroflexaceae bacterium]|nr:glycosyltransferase family 4 protein [Chloroflexaceae bacterium]
MLCYIAYPTSLSLQSANALQTYATVQALRQHAPDTLVLIARWNREPSRFADVGAVHLPRPAIGRLSRLHRSSLWYYLEYSAFAWMCVPWLLKQPVDAIYVRQNIVAAWWSGLFGPLLGIPVIYEAHDLEAHNPSRAKEPWAQGLVHLIDRIALTRASAVVSLTDDFRQYLARLGWRRPAEVFVIPDGYDATLFAPQDRLACRQALNLSPDARLVVYAGLTFAHRWLEGLLAATAALLPQIDRLQLVLVGGRPAEMANLQQQIKQHGLERHVLLTGPCPQENVVRYLAAADVCVIPDTLTDMTASPLKLFEYLAMGVPIVLPDLPSLREIVPETLVQFFPRRSTAGLTNALQAAISEPDQEERYRARQTVAAAYTYDRRAARVLDVVARVKHPSSMHG